MGNKLIPLYYAIIKHFEDGAEHCAADVIEALAPNYAGYKLLTPKDVEEALDTAKENGILEEVRADLDPAGKLRIFYRMSDFGADITQRYIG